MGENPNGFSNHHFSDDWFNLCLYPEGFHNSDPVRGWPSFAYNLHLLPVGLDRCFPATVWSQYGHGQL